MTVGTYFLYGFVLSIAQLIFIAIASKASFANMEKPLPGEYLKFFIVYILLNTTGLRILELLNL